jgi:hypothetical protein
MADPRGTAGDELIPPHLNPTAKLGAEVTRKYITPLDPGNKRFGQLYGETTWVPGSTEEKYFEEGHPAITYDPGELAHDPTGAKFTMRHELEHAGVKEAIIYQKDVVANSSFVQAGGEELRQRLSDKAQLEALGPAAMRSEAYRKQMKESNYFIDKLIKSLGDKFHMTPDEVRAKVKSYSADINQAVKKAEEARQKKSDPTASAPKPGAPTQTKAEKMEAEPKGKVDDDVHTRWHQHRNPIKITNNSGDYDMHWTDSNSELSTAPL